MPKEITPLYLQPLDHGKRARLLAPYIFWSDIVGIIEVPTDFETDFNSVPRGLWNIFPPWEFPEAGVVHDKLFRHAYTVGPGSRKVTRNEADAVHSEVLKQSGAGPWKVRLMRLGLKVGSWKTWNEHRERDPHGESANQG